MDCLESALSAGSRDAACYLYELYPKGGRPNLMAKAMESLREGAEDGDTLCMRYMADALSKGNYLAKDLDSAEAMARKALESGDGEAYGLLMFLLWKKGTDESCGEVVRISEMEASEGNSLAYYWLGRALYNGKGTEKDHDRAEIYLRKALKAKVRGSRLLLVKLLWARGTQESCAEMCRLAQPLVDIGDPAAMGYLGRAYLYGKGTEEDLSKACELLETAAKSDKAWERELRIAMKELQGRGFMHFGSVLGLKVSRYANIERPKRVFIAPPLVKDV